MGRTARRVAVLHDECLEDLLFRVDTNQKMAPRVVTLMEAVLRDPYAGAGKPDHLKHIGGNGGRFSARTAPRSRPSPAARLRMNCREPPR